MAERELAIILRARDLASKTIRGVKKELGGVGKEAKKGFGTAAGNVAKLGTAVAGISLAGIAGSIKVAADFESQLNTINTVARRTPAELDKIGDSIRGIAKSTGAPLDELTQGFYDLVSAGVDASQAITVLKSANTLAIGGLATSAETVDLLTTALNTYGVSAKKQGSESQRFADIFAKSIERGKVTAAELAASFAKVGPIAASNKIEIEELAAGYAQLTAKGVPAAEAATQMAAAMIALQRRTGPLEKLEKQTKKSYLAIAGQKGLVFAMEQLRKDADKAGVPLIDLLGRVEGLQFALNTTGPEFANYNKNLAAMGDAAGTAAGQMGERQKGLNAQLAKLKALAIDAGITIGEKLLPKITPLAEKAVAFLNTHQADIDKFGDKIAGAFDKAAAFAQKIPWDAVGRGLETAASWAGKLMDVFLKLPPEAQATIVALAGLNKLSGGAVTGIVSELGKGLIKGVLGMTAGVVNITAGVVNGGGGVPGVPGAAPGGGKGGVVGAGLKAILPVAVVGIAAEAAASLAGVTREAPNREINNEGNIVRSVTDVGQKIANLQAAEKQLAERAAGGDTFAAKQLVAVRAELAKAQGLDTQQAAHLAESIGTFSSQQAAHFAELNSTFRGVELAASLGSAAATTALAAGFREMVANLKTANTPAAISAAVKEAVAVTVTQGRGNAGNTKTVLEALKAQLKNTHDPVLKAELRSAIGKVERKLQGREWAQAQINKADQILKSNEGTKQKITELQAIERSLKDHGLPKAAAQIRAKIDEAKGAQVGASLAAGIKAATAITNKDLSVTTTFAPIIKTYVSVRETINTRTTYRQYQKTAS